jgi:hypothetical protein
MSFTVPRKLAVAATALAGVALAPAAGAANYTLRIQTHHSPETLPGKIFLQFVQDVGRIPAVASTSRSSCRARS